jgi:hypothetical protein
MEKARSFWYEIVYYDGWSMPPAYYLIGEAEGETPELALRQHLAHLIGEVRNALHLPPDLVSDAKIQETLYAVRNDGLVSARQS